MGMENFGIDLSKEEYLPLESNFDENDARNERIRLSVDEIRGQLAVTGPKYNGELEKIKAGVVVDKDWLADYQDNLREWMSDIQVNGGTIYEENAEVFNEVKMRLFLISEESEKGTIH